MLHHICIRCQWNVYLVAVEPLMYPGTPLAHIMINPPNKKQ